MKRGSIFVLLSFALLLAACVSAQPTPAATGNYRIELNSDPNPPVASDTELRVTVKDKADQPVAGADVRVMATHVGMNMGALNGKAVEQGNGQYTLQMRFSMAGDWKFTIQVDKPGQPQGVEEIKLTVN